jgi:hypothetical protein
MAFDRDELKQSVANLAASGIFIGTSSWKAFQPYDKTREVNEEARKAGAALIVEGERHEPRRKTFIYVNNGLEGNALHTIAAILDLLKVA